MPRRVKGLLLEVTVRESILFLTTSVNGTQFPTLSWIHALTRPSIGTETFALLHSTFFRYS